MKGEVPEEPTKHTQRNKISKILLDVNFYTYGWEFTTEWTGSEAGKWKFNVMLQDHLLFPLKSENNFCCFILRGPWFSLLRDEER